MSFFSNFHSDKCPGNINGNPINGLCEKVCIQARKVFDACIKQGQQENLTVTYTTTTPATVTPPLTFVSARSLSPNGVISNLEVDALPDRVGFSRVQATVTIPMEIVFVDANGVEGKAITSIPIQEDVILSVPSPSIIPYTVEATASAVSPEGSFIGDGVFQINACTTVILKIVVDVELLVPTYGYCAIPPCQDYSQEICSGFFELPLFPQTPTRNGNGNCNCPNN